MEQQKHPKRQTQQKTKWIAQTIHTTKEKTFEEHKKNKTKRNKGNNHNIGHRHKPEISRTRRMIETKKAHENNNKRQRQQKQETK